jgi:phosphoribosylformimino-5-aminoimidazole carboxamide ribotide isomerase
MMIIPAVDIMDHRVVQLVGGKPGSEQITMPDPFETAMSWVNKGAKYLHLVDLDGAFGKKDNFSVISNIIKSAGVPVEVGGGIRDADKIHRLADVGADRIIVGTKAIKDRKWLGEVASEYPGRIMLALDTKDGKITMKGWQETAPISLETMFDVIRDMPLAGILNTNVDVEGQGKGINAAAACDFIQRCPHKVVASGGVTSEKDAMTLCEAGAVGAVVGIAIYTGAMKPWEWSSPWSVIPKK